MDDEIVRQVLSLCNAVSWREEADDYALLLRLELDDHYRTKLLQIMQAQKEGSFSMQFEGSLDGGDKHWYDLRMHSRNIPGKGNVRHGVLVNIDDTKQLEAKELEVLKIKLNTQTREGFLSTIRHEVRTPLNAIVGFAQVLSLPGYQLSDAELQMYSKEIEANTSILQKMINDILLATLMHRSNISADMKPYVVNQLMSIDNWPESKDMARRNGNNIIIESPDSDICINIDNKMLAAIMENFLINASKFSPEGSTIVVHYDLVDNAFQVCVKDQGIGIAENLHERIFDSFFKLDPFKPGCGLGLFICKTYAELMGGKISVESEPGKGSVFKFTLNCQPPIAKEASR